MKHENLLRENREMKKQLREMDAGQSAQTRKVGDMEKVMHPLLSSVAHIGFRTAKVHSTLSVYRDEQLRSVRSHSESCRFKYLLVFTFLNEHVDVTNVELNRK